jgi:hypothetical protein
MNYKKILDGVQQQLAKEDKPLVDKLPEEAKNETQNNKEANQQRKKIEELRPKNPSKDAPIDGETVAEEKSLEEYKEDFLEMNIGSLNSIVKNAEQILASLSDEKVKDNLTAGWLQGKIAITEDYMTTIHDFVKYSPSDVDEEDMTPASLWENIRKKKLREGKNYKPAQPGDKDRPTPEALKRAQKKSKK